ncbi:hypothetical protein ANN_26933 [Periplaneta americana]|uniref:CCHC-type domain-containing protein n=1 Tax=Periplaneta americana TaxID=6978 RepID=A0ABQ8RWU1_PERAM|nr:hypothetical protein ANN_26933 [Periplaneta americana]
MATKVIRQHTIKATFNKDQQRPSAMEIHQWIADELNVQEDDLQTIQLVSKQHAVYLKFKTSTVYENYLQRYEGSSTLTLQSGDRVDITLSPAEEESTVVRVLNIPPEVPNERLHNVFQNFGKVKQIDSEKWSSRYRFHVDTGIRLVNIVIDKPIPSTIVVATYEAYVTYPGQEQSCFICGGLSHLRNTCPNRNLKAKVTVAPRTVFTMSDLFKNSESTSRSTVAPRSHSSQQKESEASDNLNENDDVISRPSDIMETEHQIDKHKQSRGDGVNGSTTEQHREHSTRDHEEAEQNPGTTPLPVNSETDSADEIEGTRVDSDQQKSGDGARLQSELTSVCDNKRKTSSNTSTVKNDLQGGSTSSSLAKQSSTHIPTQLEAEQTWNEMMDADDTSHRSTFATQNKDIAAQKTSKGGNRAGRLHPYKHEGSKLGFPPLRVTD